MQYTAVCNIILKIKFCLSAVAVSMKRIQK
jgi:hypothetical protein